MTKHRTGYLFKRGNVYYLEYKIHGKRVKRALRDEQGNPIATLKKARIRRSEIMAPIMVADEEGVLRAITQRLDTVSAERKAIEEENAPTPLQIANAWTAYEKATNRPDTGDATMEQYSFQFGQFARWMKERHQQISAIRDVTPQIASEYATNLIKANLSANTYNKHIRLLSLVFRILEQKGEVTLNPWARITRKKENKQSRRELTTDELEILYNSSKGEMKTLIALGVWTGLRRGDCCTLRWSEVDLRRGAIMRIPNKIARSKAQPVTIPIHPVLAQILSMTPHKERGEYILPQISEDYQNHRDRVTDSVQKHFWNCGIDCHKKDTGYQMKRDINGKPEWTENGNVKLVPTGKRAVVEVGFHSLRHSFVSLCREANAPLAVVEAIVGHSNPAMTRHYTHVGEIAAKKAIASLPSLSGVSIPQEARTVKGNESDKLKQIAKTLKGMNAKNWEKTKDRLLAEVI